MGLAVLAFLLVNPVVGLEASAMENEENSSSVNSQSNEDAGIMPLADISSTVGISFSPASGSTALTPTTAAGQSAQVNVLASVNVSNSGGYAVYLKGNSVNLVGQKDSNNVIAGISATKTYDDMDVNTWGYSASEGTTVPEGATYKAISVSGNGDKLVENANKKITSDTKTIMLSFATKVNDQKPADTYKNTITMSVVSSPRELTELAEITDMQQMTSTVCSNAKVGDTKQLRDTRDGKYYWISKLADGKCWMTQNLDLDLTEGLWPEAAASDYPTVATEYLPKTTLTSQTIETTNGSATSTQSWSFGEWVISNPDASISCGAGNNSIEGCKDGQFIKVTANMKPSTDPNFYTKNGNRTVVGNEYDAHYLIGNHYQWNTATAGTGGLITSGEATGSICPKNWQLPFNGLTNIGAADQFPITTLGSIGGLVIRIPGIDYSYSYNVADGTVQTSGDANKLTGEGYFFVKGGGVDPTDILFALAGYSGHYWSSTPTSEIGSSYSFHFGGHTRDVNVAGTSGRSYGRSIRCVAR